MWNRGGWPTRVNAWRAEWNRLGNTWYSSASSPIPEWTCAEMLFRCILGSSCREEAKPYIIAALGHLSRGQSTGFSSLAWSLWVLVYDPISELCTLLYLRFCSFFRLWVVLASPRFEMWKWGLCAQVPISEIDVVAARGHVTGEGGRMDAVKMYDIDSWRTQQSRVRVVLNIYRFYQAFPPCGHTNIGADSGDQIAKTGLSDV